MSLSSDIDTLMVARDAALEGRDSAAARLRLSVEVEFEYLRRDSFTGRGRKRQLQRMREWVREWALELAEFGTIHRALNASTVEATDAIASINRRIAAALGLPDSVLGSSYALPHRSARDVMRETLMLPLDYSHSITLGDP